MPRVDGGRRIAIVFGSVDTGDLCLSSIKSLLEPNLGFVTGSWGWFSAASLGPNYDEGAVFRPVFDVSLGSAVMIGTKSQL